MILPIAAPYEHESLYLNLEGRFRFLKQNLKSAINLCSDWEIFTVLNIYNKKFNKMLVYYFKKFFIIIYYFKKIINYFCNFFIELSALFFDLFYFIGYTNKLNLYQEFNLKLNFKFNLILNFINTQFFSFINNFYFIDLYTKNSKIMTFCALKRTKKFLTLIC